MWKNNIKKDLGEKGSGMYGLDVSGSGKRPLEDSYEHGNETSGPIKCCEILERCATGGFSRRPQLQEVSVVIILSIYILQLN
jgi:hypothetical protein